MSELVLGSDVDFLADDRPSKTNFVLHGVAAKSRITFGQTELIGEVRAHDAELPMVAYFSKDGRTQVVIAAQGIQARLVLVVLTDVFVSHGLGQRTPAENLHVAGRHNNPKFWCTSERLAIDGTAD